MRFIVALQGRAPAPAAVAARSVIVATGLRETLPAIPSLRAFYGMTLFSCAACDAWELQDRPLALIGETPDLADSRTAHRPVDRPAHGLHERRRRRRHRRRGRARGIRNRRRTSPRSTTSKATAAPSSAVRLADGTRVAIEGGFVRPQWHPALEFLAGLDVERDADGHLVVDRSGRTSARGALRRGGCRRPGSAAAHRRGGSGRAGRGGARARPGRRAHRALSACRAAYRRCCSEPDSRCAM